MNARQLEVFRAVMRNRSLTAAAQALNVSQPAVSKTLRHFEDQIGYPLFDRIGGRLLATPEAHLLYEDADRVFREIEAVRDLALRIKERRIGLLRIGASPPPTFSVLPLALAAFRARHAQVKVVLKTYGAAEMGDKLLVGDLDLALTMSALPTVAVRHEALSTVPIVVVVPAQSPLADLASIGPEDLRNETLISYGPQAEATTSLDAAFEAAGCSRNVAIEVASSVAALPMVLSGLGVAIVDGLLPWGQFAGLVARPFRPTLTMTLHLMTDSARPPSRLVRELAVDLRAAAARNSGFAAGA